MCLFTTVDFQLSKNKYKKKKEKSSSGRRRGRRKQHDKGKQQSEPEDPVDPRKSFIVKGRRYLPTGKKRLIDVTAVSKCVLWNLMQVSLYRVGISIYTDKKRLQLPFLSELLVKYVIYYFWFSPGKKMWIESPFFNMSFEWVGIPTTEITQSPDSSASWKLGWYVQANEMGLLVFADR